MKLRIYIPLLMVCFLCIGKAALAIGPELPELKCPPGVGELQDSGGICAGPDGSNITREVPGGSLLLLLPPQSSRSGGATGNTTVQPDDPDKKIIVYFFWGKGCSHCEEEKQFLAGLKRVQPYMVIREFEIWYNRENAGMMAATVTRRLEE